MSILDEELSKEFQQWKKQTRHNKNNNNNIKSAVFSIIKKWVPKWSQSDKNLLKNFLDEVINNNYLFDLFIDRTIQLIDRIKLDLGGDLLLLEKIERLYLTPSTIVPGSICFFGSLLLSLSEIRTVIRLDEVFSFTSFYMLLDHYLDHFDPKESDNLKNKKMMIEIITQLVTNPIRDETFFNSLVITNKFNFALVKAI